ncbi:MAG: helix-turn-helix domain-containing protein [Clostridia bacterium]|nr:helix-turn-helix domain-containing protein [Clostridia bacterium]
MKNPQNNISSLKKQFFGKILSSYLMIIAFFIITGIVSVSLHFIAPTIAPVATVFCVLLSLAASVYVAYTKSKKLANSVSALAEQFPNDSEIPDGTTLFTYINDKSSKVIEQNEMYSTTISEKDSLLKGIFLQSRMRDIYVSLDDVEAQLNDSPPFMMVYFRIHYKDTFFETIQEEPSKSTFFLKQLIELYFTHDGFESSTFQVENDQIVSIINAETSSQDAVVEMVNSAVKKLENESEYVFFTVVVSNLHDDSTALKAQFDRLSRLARYAKPVMENQVLIEDKVTPGAGQFYFTIEQMEKLSSLMQNGARDDCLRNLNEILDYNTKKEVSGFDLYLLCTEIVNCAVKLLNRLFHSTPASLNLNRVYIQLDRAVTVDRYQQICADLLIRVMDYIVLNKREEDYIINFILDYVENHYAEDIYLNLFADKLALTSAYISSYFKEKMNVNLTDYLNSFRIKKAVALIANPQNKNKDVAEAVGLQNINTFIRLFKKYTGYTPGEYRKKHFNDVSDL